MPEKLIVELWSFKQIIITTILLMVVGAYQYVKLTIQGEIGTVILKLRFVFSFTIGLSTGYLIASAQSYNWEISLIFMMAGGLLGAGFLEEGIKKYIGVKSK